MFRKALFSHGKYLPVCLALSAVVLLVSVLSVAAFAEEQPGGSAEDERTREQRFRESERQARELAQKVLDGRQVVARIYNDWQSDPVAFELVGLALEGLSLSIDSAKSALEEMSESAIVAVVGEDQQDEAVAAVVDDFVHAKLYVKGSALSVWPTYFGDQDKQRWVFRDALGNPMSQATVEILLGCQMRDNGRAQISVKKATLDENGRLMPLRAANAEWTFSFLVSHPDYGAAFAESPGQPGMYVVPLVRAGTQADQRSIWGTVVDPNGNPVSGVIVECRGALAPGHVGVSPFPPASYRTLTDEKGYFALHLALEGDTLVPPISKYGILIRLPNDRGPAIDYGYVQSGRECRITVGLGRRFRTFVFEDAKGPIVNPTRLTKIKIIIDRLDGREVFLGYDRWKDGGVFPAGTYTAALQDTRPLVFKPIEVTADSLEQLVFVLEEEVVYCGRVIDGITGRPMPGAIVMLGALLEPDLGWGDFSVVSPQQWQGIHALPADPPLEDPALEPVKRLCGFWKIVRTDQDGRFEITDLPRRDRLTELVVIEQDYLGYAHDLFGRDRSRTSEDDSLKPDQNGLVKIPPVKLFPAAKVLFEPYIEQADDSVQIRARLLIDEENNPAWAGDFLASSYVFNRQFWASGWQCMHVPAGLNLDVKLFPVPGHVGGVSLHAIILPGTNNLAQGQTLDLGRQSFAPAEPTFLICLKVVDPQGRPTEGVGVWSVPQDKRFWQQSRVTDENGIALVPVAPYSRGQFCVFCEDKPNNVRLKECASYEVQGDEDAGRQFTLQLSDEMLRHLSK